jgi:hypothetical protein
MVFASKALGAELAEKISFACVNNQVSPYIFTSKEASFTVVTSKLAICRALHRSGSCMYLNTQTTKLHANNVLSTPDIRITTADIMTALNP